MNQEYLKTIKEVIAERGGVEESTLRLDSLFAEDLNLTNLELGEIITELEEKFEVEIKLEIEEIKTIGELVTAFSEVLD